MYKCSLSSKATKFYFDFVSMSKIRQTILITMRYIIELKDDLHTPVIDFFNKRLLDI